MQYQKLSSLLASYGISIAIASNPVSASTQTNKTNTTDRPNKLPNAVDINKQIQKNYPPELLEQAGSETTAQSTNPSKNSQQNSSIDIPRHSTTVTSANNISLVIPTPALIAIFVLVGGLAAFPIVHLFWKSREVKANSIWQKLTAKWRKPTVLESDNFLHQRNLDKLIEIAKQAENLNAEKFNNYEFTTFIKIKSYIARKIEDYANLDEIIDMINAAIITQNSFLLIEQTESRYCSATQQKLYSHVVNLLKQNITPDVLNQEINSKLEEVLPQLKTEEGRLALQSYAKEMGKIAAHPLGIKLLSLFKQYQFEDYSTIRTVSHTLNQLESENLLDLDALLMLVLKQYDAFEKIGPIVGVAPEYNRPETYSKILQYLGLKSRHEASYSQFQELLKLLSKWENYAQLIREIRKKYNSSEYEIPKEFTMELPSSDLYEKFKDRLQILSPEATANTSPHQNSVKSDPSAVKSPAATGVR